MSLVQHDAVRSVSEIANSMSSKEEPVIQYRPEEEHVVRTDEPYLQTALRLQRWRDLFAHLTAYALMNVVFIIAWALNGGGYFWPAFPILGWGLGLSFQHFHVVIRGFITDAEVRRSMQPANGPTTGRN